MEGFNGSLFIMSNMKPRWEMFRWGMHIFAQQNLNILFGGGFLGGGKENTLQEQYLSTVLKMFKYFSVTEHFFKITK